MLRDILEETCFMQTTKLMKKQQLLFPFAKDLAALWSKGSQFGSQHETGPQKDFVFHRSPMAEIRSNSPEEKPHKPASRGHRNDGIEVFQVSSSSSQHSTCQSMDTSSKPMATGSPNAELAGRRKQRMSFRDPQLDTVC
ncbi:hypothetical protein I79_021832 [Cricetulus griseus]|uniref:Uncharacterized protein n=1 Tax=Cricetulus griseus TaxID=10029 RepID=G3IDP9_CRIGR|nr:hypothetical protein I79_021832 [Cricetulus griseus]